MKRCGLPFRVVADLSRMNGIPPLLVDARVAGFLSNRKVKCHVEGSQMGLPYCIRLRNSQDAAARVNAAISTIGQIWARTSTAGMSLRNTPLMMIRK